MVTLKEQIKINYELSKKLSKEYNDVYGDIVLYLRTSKLNDVDAEDAVSDILAMMLDGQERNATIEEIFGDDLKVFCENIINSYVNDNKTIRIREPIQYSLIILCIGTFFNYMFMELPQIIKGTQNIFIINYSLAMLINTITMGFTSIFGIRYILSVNFETNKKKKLKTFIIEFLKVFILFGINIIILSISIYFLKNIILFTTKIYFVVLFIAALFLIYKILEPKIE